MSTATASGSRKRNGSRTVRFHRRYPKHAPPVGHGVRSRGRRPHGLHTRHIRALIADGHLSAERVGARAWAIDPTALDHYRHHRGETAA